ncbi:TetR/AcrR family transcriptional regulator [Methyloligella solikamskensis]|uniref:TetR/AcrR family transcriptional regulator n=1 Tax=Methyloligella solikamskensis TaxID=1177756 RepID=A0ABW3J614_9HYPH
MAATSHSTDARNEILDTAQAVMSAKGFSAVGLNEILAKAGVPKGSFYHYFPSKEAFGTALLERYFKDYLIEMEERFSQPGMDGAAHLMSYWDKWLETQRAEDTASKCLVVKLSAEVADLSDAMRLVLLSGTKSIVERLARAIDAAVADGSLAPVADSQLLAETLYQTWLGASLLSKITRNDAPLKTAMIATRRSLKLEK